MFQRSVGSATLDLAGRVVVAMSALIADRLFAKLIGRAAHAMSSVG